MAPRRSFDVGCCSHAGPGSASREAATVARIKRRAGFCRDRDLVRCRPAAKPLAAVVIGALGRGRRLPPWRARPRVPFLGGRRRDRHGLGVDRAYDGVRIRRREAVAPMLADDRIGDGPACARPGGPDAGEGKQRPRHVRGEGGGRLPGLVSAHSQNDVTGTRQRVAGPSQRRQCGPFVLRMFVSGAPPN